MKPEDAKSALEERIVQSGLMLPRLLPATGFALMVDFYRDVRAEGCDVSEQGDMLLFQWGTYDFDGKIFTCDLTRQFILSGLENEDDDASMSQLSFTFGFTPSPEFDSFGDGNRCADPRKNLVVFKTSWS